MNITCLTSLPIYFLWPSLSISLYVPPLFVKTIFNLSWTQHPKVLSKQNLTNILSNLWLVRIYVTSSLLSFTIFENFLPFSTSPSLKIKHVSQSWLLIYLKQSKIYTVITKNFKHVDITNYDITCTSSAWSRSFFFGLSLDLIKI